MMRSPRILSTVVLVLLTLPLLLSPTTWTDADQGNWPKYRWADLITSRIAVSPDGAYAFFPGPSRHSLVQVSLTDGKVVDYVWIGTLINGVEIHPDGKSVVVTAPLMGGVIPVKVGPLTPGKPVRPGGSSASPVSTDERSRPRRPSGAGTCASARIVGIRSRCQVAPVTTRPPRAPRSRGYEITSGTLMPSW